MDKKIPEKEQRRRRLRRLAVGFCAVALVVAAVMWLASAGRSSVRESQLKFGTVDRGDIESSITATGTVVPASEESVLSPISSRVIEVFKRPGDAVEAGDTLLRLDLDNINAELDNLRDQLVIKRENLRQKQIKADADLENRRMQAETKELLLEQLRRDVENERYLDSIGSGTGENVRRAESALWAAENELRQLRRDLVNQEDFTAAGREIDRLEMAQFMRGLEEKEKLRQQALITSPRKAILTDIVGNIGQAVGAQSVVATIADLSSYHVAGSIPDTYVDKVSVGSDIMIYVNKLRVAGHITEVSPVSKSSVLEFQAATDGSLDSLMSPGLRVDVHVVTEVVHERLRLPNGSYFTSGPGNYELFVMEGSELVRRRVTLGRSNIDYVEVISGLEQGERVVINDMGKFRQSVKLRVKS